VVILPIIDINRLSAARACRPNLGFKEKRIPEEIPPENTSPEPPPVDFIISEKPRQAKQGGSRPAKRVHGGTKRCAGAGKALDFDSSASVPEKTEKQQKGPKKQTFVAFGGLRRNTEL
jgi:hypothetical protein